MSINNPIQFAVTREDPEIEIELLKTHHLKNVLAICSGGDTLLAISHALPEVKITAFDFNPAQISHFKNKAAASGATLNSEPTGLCQIGNFESLFRQWRLFFNEFVLSPSETELLFDGESAAKLKDQILTSKYWPVSFNLHFHESFLLAMFGEAAIQHAPKGSYPRYFQKAFEKGLNDRSFHENPFLQHLFLGKYKKLPSYFQYNNASSINLVQGTLFEVPGLNEFDLIQLSNIFDWSNEEEIKQTCSYLNQTVKDGAFILIRQINNEAPIHKFLGPDFELHEELAAKLITKDRSLFYSKLVIAQKRERP